MKVADMHCDTLYRLLDRQEKGAEAALKENDGHLDLLRMEQSRYLVQNFAMFVKLDDEADPWERVCRLFALYGRELEANRDILAPVYRFSDIAENEAAGKLSAMLTVEEGGVCGGEEKKLRELFDMGVRMLTLTWNFPNELGHPNINSRRKPGRDALYTPNLTEGLTETGKRFVVQMEQLGMIPDVSHLSDAGFYDVLAVTKKPFVASHSNARSVCRCVRNLTDDMIRRLAERGGCMGLNYCADFLEEAPAGQKNPGTLAAVVRHARYIANVGGVEVLGLGSDFDGIDTHEELPGAQSMGRLWDALKADGFTEAQLDKIFWQNVLRVYRDTLPS